MSITSGRVTHRPATHSSKKKHAGEHATSFGAMSTTSIAIGTSTASTLDTSAAASADASGTASIGACTGPQPKHEIHATAKIHVRMPQG
jgi:hypothetical protein